MTAAKALTNVVLRPPATDTSEEVASEGAVGDSSVGFASVVIVLDNIQTSPVASEVTQILSLSWSTASPAGLKQSLGHFEGSPLVKRSFAAVMLSEASTGLPSLNVMLETL